MRAARIRHLGALLVCLAGCTSPAPFWTSPVPNVTYGLTGGVALVDDPNHRVVLLQGRSDQTLEEHSFTIGHNFQSAAVSPDGSTLFVISTGDQPVQTPQDQLPSLTVISLNSSLHATSSMYTMPDPLSNLAVDPLGDYVVAWSGSNTAFAENPNEIVIFNLKQPFSPSPGTPSAPPNPVARNIRSFGGIPQQLVYSPSLNLPANPPPGVTQSQRRLLFVETTLDVSIVDLTNAFQPWTSSTSFGRPEITVQLTSGTSTTSLSPAGLVVDPNPDDGRLAFFTTGDRSVYTVQLLASSPGAPNDFTPQINLTDVGGIPSDIQFVRTDAGLRVAALVPSNSNAVLVEPDTSQTTPVSLAAGFTSMSLVTNVVSSAPGGSAAPNTDVALLWSTESGVAAGVALWTLGTTVGQPYRSIEVLSVNEPIQGVLDVPGSTYGSLKVLAPQAGAYGGGDFYVLDLVARTASPIHTTTSPTLSISPDGMRMWAYDQSTNLAQIDFGTLNPVPLTTRSPISVVYDIQNVGTGSGRSLVAIHGKGALGATVFDAISPQATARINPALLLEDP
jgi:hypothetical protein